MNSQGDITGFYIDTGAGRDFGFLLRNGIVTTINFPNSSDSDDNTVINDNGVIAGGFCDVAGCNVAGTEHGFIAICSGSGC